MTVRQLTFRSYEEQLSYLREGTGAWTPVLTAGRAEFFGGFSRWLMSPSESHSSDPFVSLPNPSHNLSLPYPRDELAVALTASRGYVAGEDEVTAHASTFGFPQELLSRPTVSLSGGEQSLLSLSKAAAYAECHRDLVLVSPTFWLDSHNHPRVRQLIDQHSARGGAVTILLLEGEALNGEHATELCDAPELLRLPWKLLVDQPEVVFQEENFPRYTDEHRIRFSTPNERLDLVSPVLFRGPNGVGKTSFAKCLGGLLQPVSGHLRTEIAGYVDEGAGRVVLQDSIVQLFGESILDHLERVFRFDALKREEVLKLFAEFQQRFATFLSENPGAGVIGCRAEPPRSPRLAPTASSSA